MSEVVAVTLVRHGRTAFNASGRIQGRVDNPLDDLGRRQAAAVAEALSSEVRGGALVIHSPLVRAAETARAIAGRGGVAKMVDPDWIELDYGDFDGLHQSQVDARTWAAWRADAGFRPPNGESLLDVEHRVRSAIDRIRGLGVRSVIVVSHVSPIKAAVTLALGVEAGIAWRTRLDPASVCRIELSKGGAALLGFNDTSHLA
ncbi:MAG: histidine phosphatase family protein [Actinomycetota bacterium]